MVIIVWIQIQLLLDTNTDWLIDGIVLDFADLNYGNTYLEL